MGRSIGLLILLLGYSSSQGGEVLDSLATHSKSEFHIVTSMLIKGDSQQVFDVLTDYQLLAEISDIVLESNKITKKRVLADEPIRVRINTRTCLLVFCFKAQIVEDVEIIDDLTIKAVIYPELSDFKSGEIIIQVQDYAEGQAQVIFDSRFIPDFWVPPIIGPMVIKHKALQSATNTIYQIEKILSSE